MFLDLECLGVVVWRPEEVNAELDAEIRHLLRNLEDQ
jgi:hypothetical protein